eukprot:gb/GFBE01067560.1/.p1 GENE.gb/GFBE01067560.1/~~gb/GFBE01067560.1/.p1  ORF type:complete len:131 (+),score=13.43 gb/GFBE01067560.1/:1-393(+)
MAGHLGKGLPKVLPHASRRQVGSMASDALAPGRIFAGGVMITGVSLGVFTIPSSLPKTFPSLVGIASPHAEGQLTDQELRWLCNDLDTAGNYCLSWMSCAGTQRSQLNGTSPTAAHGLRHAFGGGSRSWL